MSDRTFRWQDWVSTRPSGPVAARIIGVRTILQERAHAARVAAKEPRVDPRFAASLRGKAHAYAEAAELLSRIDQGHRLGFKKWTRKDKRVPEAYIPLDSPSARGWGASAEGDPQSRPTRLGEERSP